MKKRARAVFLTALVLYATGNTTTVNKEKSAEIITLNNKVKNPTNITLFTNPLENEEFERPEEIMFLFDYQQNQLETKLQESPKIKKKYRRKR